MKQTIFALVSTVVLMAFAVTLATLAVAAPLGGNAGQDQILIPLCSAA